MGATSEDCWALRLDQDGFDLETDLFNFKEFKELWNISESKGQLSSGTSKLIMDLRQFRVRK
jgi:hypothetical protein